MRRQESLKGIEVVDGRRRNGSREGEEKTTAVVQSLGDPSARLHYRFYLGTKVGDKFLCVIVKVSDDDAFVLTAYLTDKIKKGVQLWPTKR